MSGTILQSSNTGRSETQWGTNHAAWVSHTCKYAVVTSDATGLNLTAGKPGVLYGIQLISAGTMASVYDSLAAAGTVIIPSSTATVTFGGLGIYCPTGITADWTSGTWLVLFNF